MAGKFIKCPRCELNYINCEKQNYCDVCLAELKLGPDLKFADLEDEDVDDEMLDICPTCKINYIAFNEDECESCREAKDFDKEKALDELEDGDDWKEFLDEDIEDDDVELDEVFDGDDEFEDSELDETIDGFDETVDDFDFDDDYDLDEYDDEEDDDDEDDDF